MEKKTVATTIFSCLIVAFIISIGATISAFKVSNEKVCVNSIVVEKGVGVSVSNKKGIELSSLDVKSSAVGVRPATGEENNDTSIPTTVNDAVGTEGAYAYFNLTTEGAYDIILKSCSLSCGKENLDNVRVAIMEEKNDPISGSDFGAVLATSAEKAQEKEVVVVVWLDKTTTKSIAGAKIDVVIEIKLK